MAPDPNAPSFDEIIQKDRQRRKDEALAQEIFGKGRRASTPLLGAKRKPGTGPSLASRVGVAKASQRSSSSAPKLGSHNRQHPTTNQATRLSGLPRDLGRLQVSKNNPLFGRSPAPQPTASPVNGKASGGGISIRGLAGPYVVVGSNFAPGTTSADIQSAMEPVGGEMQSCKIVSSSPTVIAEMVFTDKQGAENVIATFNNQKADNRLLYVYMKQGPATQIFPAAAVAIATANRPTPTGPRAGRTDLARLSRLEDPPVAPTHDSSREHVERNGRQADPEYQDASYGFEEQPDAMEVETNHKQDSRQDNRYDDRRRNQQEDARGRNTNPRRDNGRGRDDRGLYSDSLYPHQRGRGFR